MVFSHADVQTYGESELDRYSERYSIAIVVWDGNITGDGWVRYGNGMRNDPESSFMPCVLLQLRSRCRAMQRGNVCRSSSTVEALQLPTTVGNSYALLLPEAPDL
jgi:hypothetical protein